MTTAKTENDSVVRDGMCCRCCKHWGLVLLVRGITSYAICRVHHVVTRSFQVCDYFSSQPPKANGDQGE